MTGRCPPSRRVLPLLLLVLALLVSGCVDLPVAGPVQAGPSAAVGTEEAPYDFNPAGPKPDGAPVDIVDGFLLAMQATPQNTSVARQFLTPEARANWSPDAGTVIYDSYTLAAAKRSVTVRLADTARLDSRGEWQGVTPGKRGIALHLKVVKSHGQWRISNPPDALVIPRTHFESRFQQFNVYFFDRSGQVLVPEPVYLPAGEQAPTLLVRDLLRGPDKDLLGATRTYIPAKTRLDDVSVPVSGKGVATVALNEPMAGLGPEQRKPALAQLAWTLAQVSGIERMQVTVDGSPLEVPGQDSMVRVDAWSEADPAVTWASHQLFGLRDGHVVTVFNGHESKLPGGFGSAVRSVAVDLPAQRVAAVTDDGGSVLVLRPGQAAGSGPSATAQPVYEGGTDLLKPAWDLYDQLWLVDRTAGGAVLTVLRSGTPTRVTVPGITGQDVKAFSLSRDGTRLVAVIAGNPDRVVISRVMRKANGDVTSVTKARPLPVTTTPVGHIRDVAWFSPTTVAVLAVPEPGVCQVFLARVDGSSGYVESTAGTALFRGPGKALHVVTAPAPGTPLYLDTSKGLLALGSSGRWTAAGVRAGLLSPTFVG